MENVAALAPVLLLGLAFIAYCLVDLAKRSTTRHLPRWAWAIVIVVSIPLGGILYLLLGCDQR
jgi:predicted ABC-type exoprotein transport system permease subunit